ncbi:MAG: Ig-like domain-containing protein [Flavobacteriaceae bacterium]|nr:Ig-like domain-containing protein [Flavobacteriaceae bacterium]
MKSHYFIRSLIFLSIFTLFACARRGRPTGGPKDEEAPIVVTAEPDFETVNFKAKKINIDFDEFIKLKDVGKQLIVSPPLKYKPIITPLGTASKTLKIKILDTLKPKTTYIFNFGNSVQDNNEGNVLYNFKYVMSTGNYIDSLKLKGKIKDALSNVVDKEVAILLYKLDSTYNDSIIYKGSPNYIANTLDTVVWEITNIKEGKYLLTALKQKRYNYKFNPKTDKIAFYTDTINITTDKTISFSDSLKTLIDKSLELSLFREELDYKLARPSEMDKQHIVFGYEGDAKDLELELLSDVPEDFKSVQSFQIGKDSLDYWFNIADLDSLKFKVTNNTYIDTVTVKLHAKDFDSLVVGSSIRASLNLRDDFKLKTNQPITKVDTTKIVLIDKDSIKVPFAIQMSDFKTELIFKFNKMPNNIYKLMLLPQAINTFFESSKDTIRYKFTTKNLIDYGSVSISLSGVKSYPVIVQIIDKKAKVVQSKYLKKAENINFTILDPTQYLIRVIYDKNKNGKWDTGSFSKRIQPEEVIYFPKEIEVRANWEITELFDVSK